VLFAKEYHCRKANLNDLHEILLKLKVFLVQQHLDWESIPDQIRTGKMYLCYLNNELAGILSISGIHPNNQWIKIFAVRNETQKYTLWNKLVLAALDQDQTGHFYTIAYWDWFRRLVNQADGFSPFVDIVTLENTAPSRNVKPYTSEPHHIRPITEDDIEEIYSIDQNAFAAPWQLDIQNLLSAIRQSKIASMVLVNDKVAGYLLCDQHNLTAHLSRIAVSPDYARKNLGSDLIHSLFREITKLGVITISVNTQANNVASLNLYRKFGFSPTGESISTYRYDRLIS
jgi:ribosomal-protein-alanine N-acetyltransferase